MKKNTSVVLLASFLLLTLGAFAATTTAAAAKPEPTSDRSPAATAATAITTVTGLAISPLLGTGVYGAYQYFTAKDEAAKAALPWYAQMKFWAPALLLVALCAAKDSFGAVTPPGLKKPLDVLETVENKVTGLVAAGAVVPITVSSLSQMAFGSGSTAGHVVWPQGLAMLPVAAMDFTWLLNLLTVPFAVAMFALVWMASHAITVLILLSPWGAVDAVLKAARTAVLGLLTVTASINPWMGALLSLVVVVVAYFVAGWSFRLTVFGSIFCWDFFTGRKGRFTPAPERNAMFAGGDLRGVPVRTYGQLARNASGALEFTYRPWLVMAAKTLVLPADARLAVGKGLFFSTVTSEGAGTYFVLPPRYRSHEDELARIYQMPGGVQPAGLRKAWRALGELFGGGAKAKA